MSSSASIIAEITASALYILCFPGTESFISHTKLFLKYTSNFDDKLSNFILREKMRNPTTQPNIAFFPRVGQTVVCCAFDIRLDHDQRHSGLRPGLFQAHSRGIKRNGGIIIPHDTGAVKSASQVRSTELRQLETGSGCRSGPGG